MPPALLRMSLSEVPLSRDTPPCALLPPIPRDAVEQALRREVDMGELPAQVGEVGDRRVCHGTGIAAARAKQRGLDAVKAVAGIRPRVQESFAGWHWGGLRAPAPFSLVEGWRALCSLSRGELQIFSLGR
jgi:hypothetical protein